MDAGRGPMAGGLGGLAAGGAAMALCWGAGCAGPGLSAGMGSPDPGARLHAIDDAVERQDRGAIPDLVNLLDSDDPVVRMLSVRALERLTGQTLGYDHAAPTRARQEAIGRWRAWLAEQGMAPSALPADTDGLIRPEATTGARPLRH